MQWLCNRIRARWTTATLATLSEDTWIRLRMPFLTSGLTPGTSFFGLTLETKDLYSNTKMFQSDDTKRYEFVLI